MSRDGNGGITDVPKLFLVGQKVNKNKFSLGYF